MIGLGSYAYFWRHRDGLGLDDALRETADLGLGLFQVCDFPAIEDADHDAVRSLADDLGIALELGTRGTHPDHLRRYLGIAEALGATLLRSMVNSPDAAADLDELAPELAERGIALALETYEQVPTAELVRLVRGRDGVGICLDPGNTVSILEHPADVIDIAAQHTINVHVKDFAFSRAEGWVGFSLAGTTLGDGLLPLDDLLTMTSGANRIVEHWLPWQGDAETTCALERDWTLRSIEVLREKERT
jgi:3-oxoisoapionate decarboxylase